MGDEIIVFVFPAERVRAGGIPAGAVTPLSVQIPVEIAERDLAVAGDCFMQTVNVVVNALVHGLHAAGYDDLPPQRAAFIAAGQRTELFNELQRLLFGEKFGRLDGVDEQLQLRQFKLAGGEIIAAAWPLDLHDVHTIFPEVFDVGIDAFPLGTDAALLQQIDQFLRCERMGGVCRDGQDILEIEQLQLLLFRAGHGIISFAYILLYRTESGKHISESL